MKSPASLPVVPVRYPSNAVILHRVASYSTRTPAHNSDIINATNSEMYQGRSSPRTGALPGTQAHCRMLPYTVPSTLPVSWVRVNLCGYPFVTYHTNSSTTNGVAVEVPLVVTRPSLPRGKGVLGPNHPCTLQADETVTPSSWFDINHNFLLYVYAYYAHYMCAGPLLWGRTCHRGRGLRSSESRSFRVCRTWGPSLWPVVEQTYPPPRGVMSFR